jgi:hypothetical protein
VRPALVAYAAARGGRGPVGVVAVEPDVDVVEVNLLRPEHPGERLPLHAPLVLGGVGRVKFGVELVGLAAPRLDDLVGAAERVFQLLIRQPQLEDDGAAGRDVEGFEVKAGFRAGGLGVDRRLAVDYVAVEGVLDEALATFG